MSAQPFANGDSIGHLKVYSPILANRKKHLAQQSKVFVVHQDYINPFNPSTFIGFSVLQNRNVKITVYNSIGQKVATLINSELQAGNHKVNFDASKLTSGIYFYTMESGNFIQTKKLLLMK